MNYELTVDQLEAIIGRNLRLKIDRHGTTRYYTLSGRDSKGKGLISVSYAIQDDECNSLEGRREIEKNLAECARLISYESIGIM